MGYVCGVMYEVLYVRVSCFVGRGRTVSRRYIGVNVYIDHLKVCVGCNYGGRYVCCGECNVAFK